MERRCEKSDRGLQLEGFREYTLDKEEDDHVVTVMKEKAYEFDPDHHGSKSKRKDQCWQGV